MKIDAKTEAAVMRAFENLWKAYEKRDSASLLSLVAPDPDVLVYGTGADEKRIGRKEVEVQFKRDWSQSEAASLRFQRHTVSSSGPVAWVAADGAAHVKVAGGEVEMPLRVTTIFEQRGDKWLVVHMHVSTPASEQAEGESWAPPPR